MNTSGCTCRGIEIDVQNSEFTVFIILFVILYADDTIILSETIKRVQDTLYAFNEYCKRLKLKINTKGPKGQKSLTWTNLPICHLEVPIRTIFSYFLSTSHPDTSYQALSQLASGFRRRSKIDFQDGYCGSHLGFPI